MNQPTPTYIVPLGRPYHGSVGFRSGELIPDTTAITLSSSDKRVLTVPSGPFVGLSLPVGGCVRRAFVAQTVGIGVAQVRAQFVMRDNTIKWLTLATVIVVPVSEGIDLEFYSAVPESLAGV